MQRALSYAGPEREGEYYDAIRSCLALVEGGGRLRRCFPMKAGDFVLFHRQRLEPPEVTLIPLPVKRQVPIFAPGRRHVARGA